MSLLRHARGIISVLRISRRIRWCGYKPQLFFYCFFLLFFIFFFFFFIFFFFFFFFFNSSLVFCDWNLTESMLSFRPARPNHSGAQTHYFIVRLNHFPAISSLVDAGRVLLRGQFGYKLEGPYYRERVSMSVNTPFYSSSLRLEK